MIQRKRLCDQCNAEIEIGVKYMRVEQTLLLDKRTTPVWTASHPVAQSVRELCLKCVDPDQVARVEAETK
jgi:hypothetical protein